MGEDCPEETDDEGTEGAENSAGELCLSLERRQTFGELGHLNRKFFHRFVEIVDAIDQDGGLGGHG